MESVFQGTFLSFVGVCGVFLQIRGMFLILLGKTWTKSNVWGYARSKHLMSQIPRSFSPGGHSTTKHTGGWFKGLSQKPQNIYPKIEIFKN